jgi:hypothetical protein
MMKSRKGNWKRTKDERNTASTASSGIDVSNGFNQKQCKALAMLTVGHGFLIGQACKFGLENYFYFRSMECFFSSQFSIFDCDTICAEMLFRSC